MAFTGWNPGGEKEIYTLEELVSLFELEKIHKGGAIFNKEKLLWMNKEHIKLKTSTEQLEAISGYFKEYPNDILGKLLPTIIDRISVYGELTEIEPVEFRFFIERPVFTSESILEVVWKNSNKENAVKHLKHVSEILSGADFSSIEVLKQVIMPYAEIEGKGNVLWPLRMSLSGKQKSVDPFTICYVLGKDEVRIRIDSAIKMLDS